MKVGAKIFLGYLVVILALVALLLVIKYTVDDAKAAGVQTSALLAEAEENIGKLQAISSQLEVLGQLNSAVYSSGYIDKYDQLFELQNKILDLISKSKEMLPEIEATNTQFYKQLSDLINQIDSKSEDISIMLMSVIGTKEALAGVKDRIEETQKLLKSLEEQKKPLVQESPGWDELLSKIAALEERARTEAFNPEAAKKLREETEATITLENFSIWQIEKLWDTSVLPSVMNVGNDLADLKVLARELVVKPQESEELLTKLEEAATTVIKNVDFLTKMGYFALNPVDAAIVTKSVETYVAKLKKYSEIMAQETNVSRQYTLTVESYTVTQEQLNTKRDEVSSFFRDELTPLVDQISKLLNEKAAEIRASIAGSFERVRTNAQTTVTNISRIFNITAIVTGILIAVVLILTFSLNANISGALKRLMIHAQQFSQRNLTEIPEETHRKDEIGQLQNAFVEMARSLKSTLSDLVNTASVLSSQSQNIAASIEENSATSQEIAATVNEFSKRSDSAVSRLNRMVQRLQELAESSQKLSSNASDTISKISELTETIQKDSQQVGSVAKTASAVGDKVKLSAQKLEALNEITTAVSSFVKNIGDIAEQTNLLALNAAIEAARAGEAGKGFAVVAEEVRQLAEESARIAANVQETISRVDESVRDVVETTTANLEDVAKIVKNVEEIGERMKEIASSVSETASTIQAFADYAVQEGKEIGEVSIEAGKIGEEFSAMSDDVNTLKSAVQDSSKAMEDLSKSAEELAELARKLDELSKEYTI